MEHAAQNDQDQQGESRDNRPQRRKRMAILIAAVSIILLGVLIYWLLTRGRVSTDDAQIEGNIVPISPRVSGYVKHIYVNDNQLVAKGQLLVQLDRRDLVAQLHKSEATLATQHANERAANQQVAIVERTAPSAQQQAAAGVGSASAALSASRDQLAAARAQAESAQAGVEAAISAVSDAQGGVDAATAQLSTSISNARAAQAQILAAQAQAQEAQSDLRRYTSMYRSGAVSRQQYERIVATAQTAQSNLNAVQAQAAAAQAAIGQARAQRSRAQSQLGQAYARLSAARSAAAQATAGVKAAESAVSQAQAVLRQAQANSAGAQTATEQVAASKAQRGAARAGIRQSAADVRGTKLKLSYTRISAPVSGVVSEKSVQPGQYVEPGQALMALVPLNQTWVVANFKETQIKNMRSGQTAIVRVDTYPGQTFIAKVQSIGAATGAQFSLLPPQNASGNFVKVVQRIPVKIVFDNPLPGNVVFRPGQNVTATVYTQGR